jgi:hypothetical protein
LVKPFNREYMANATPPNLKWTLAPLLYPLRKRMRPKSLKRYYQVADRTWQLAPVEITISRPAYYLPNQLERVTGTAYTDDPRREMEGGLESRQGPLYGYLLKNAFLCEGAIYKDSASLWLTPRSSYFPKVRIDQEIDRGSIYSSFEGNAFFGLWLMDDCPTYPLAAQEGTPITTIKPTSPHMLEYEKFLEMYPQRCHSAFLREVVIFDDLSQTKHKRARFRALVGKMLSRTVYATHPGVFIMRRNSGKRRILNNELELAEYLHRRRGFKVVDITTENVPEIIAACAGARVVAGVEGSHLVHGIMVLEPGCSVLTLQPPNRFCAVIKQRATDPDMQNFGFVVGYSEGNGFRIDAEEVERTLDLFPKSP